VPAGSYSTLKLLRAAVSGNHVHQVFTVNYTDGTSDSFIQSMSGWTAPQDYAGESAASITPYRVRLQQGQIIDSLTYVYGYSFAINNAKMISNISLPDDRDIVVLSAALVPCSTQSQAFREPAMSVHGSQRLAANLASTYGR